ncbi:MAG TPA: sigma-70 family RNA polymerase sigma factor [Gemmataceae bacterium]|jgi:RNA polymerase sigma-70 factor (ECF subfamily)
MSPTSATLLERLRDRADAEAWQRLVDLYQPLLTGWLRRHALQVADVDDLVQEVLATVASEAPRFRHSGRPGAFRHWLRTILANRLREFWRARRLRPAATGDSDFVQMLDQLEDADSGLSHLWEQEHDQHVARRLLDMIEPQFAPSTWQAFRRVVLDGARPDAVAEELGLTLNAVFIAKSRVLQRLRQEARDLLD